MEGRVKLNIIHRRRKYSKLEEYLFLFSIPIGILAVAVGVYTFLQGYQENDNQDKFFGIFRIVIYSLLTIMFTRTYNRLRKKRRNLQKSS
jgi:pilus assembly protein TadC